MFTLVLPFVLQVFGPMHEQKKREIKNMAMMGLRVDAFIMSLLNLNCLIYHVQNRFLF